MESRLKVLGHPVHPMLITFPIGLLVTAVLFDIADAVGGPRFLGEVAYWNIVVGLIGGVLAAVAGFFDLLAIPAGTRAKRIGIVHALVNLSVILLFVGVWAVRMAADERGAGGGLLAIEVVALGGLALGAWFGGELVDRLGVGVDPDAGLDAPSSLRARRSEPSVRAEPAALIEPDAPARIEPATRTEPATETDPTTATTEPVGGISGPGEAGEPADTGGGTTRPRRG